jgi:hypothetical protein
MNKPHDPDQLEREIEQAFTASRAKALITQADFTPPIEEDVSRLTSLAVMAQHQQAAEAIKQLGEIVRTLSSGHEQALQELDAMGKLIVDAAAKYTALGQERSELIARSAKIMGEVKTACQEVMSKIDET